MPCFIQGEKLKEKMGDDFNTITCKAVMNTEIDGNERNMQSFDKMPHSITYVCKCIRIYASSICQETPITFYSTIMDKIYPDSL